VPAGLINGVNRNFTLSQTPISNASALIMVDGVVQTLGVDYTLNFTAIRFAVGSRPRTGNSILAYYWVAT